jgi:hypothetical protein
MYNSELTVAIDAIVRSTGLKGGEDSAFSLKDITSKSSEIEQARPSVMIENVYFLTKYSAPNHKI